MESSERMHVEKLNYIYSTFIFKMKEGFKNNLFSLNNLKA